MGALNGNLTSDDWWTDTQGATAPSARSADQPQAEVVGWTHPIRVTTLHPVGPGEHHGDTPAVKVENVADNGVSRQIEGGDHRLLLRLDYRGQWPPVDPAAQDRGRRQDLPDRTVSSSACLRHLRASTQDGDGGGARPIRGPPVRPRGGQQRQAAAATRPSRPLFLSIAVVATTLAAAPSRRQGGVARRQARPRLASATGQWQMRGQPDANQTWRAASTVSTPHVPSGFRMTDGCHRSSRHR